MRGTPTYFIRAAADGPKIALQLERPQAPELLLLALDTLPSSDSSGIGGEICGQHFLQY